MFEFDLLLFAVFLLGIVWAPRTWVAGELVTASNLNIQLRDHLNAARAKQTTALTGSQDDFALDGPFVYLRCTNAARLTLTGIQADGGNVDGARIIIEATDDEVALTREDRD